ncbi:hypothetical protein SARC_06878 [Sphaeroforma arctica JP610]|uniref:Uncharacterized protein n=1 Tax=Sphaeroforma arctica JP610 TaxID=667725 RepID=A0A0L0FVV0_9EUKA|nr:hypothetical protein SARC_06878 [Sphaeroforma arctica JP610]KNC80769.1 hypothetical protein SARC_06878 [Sphaeroforma arctica JP610]|eukprot:XP_014154671.1 hypothetical protein SARC_06878 [Sphaeroforma arctica JP610]
MGGMGRSTAAFTCSRNMEGLWKKLHNGEYCPYELQAELVGAQLLLCDVRELAAVLNTPGGQSLCVGRIVYSPYTEGALVMAPGDEEVLVSESAAPGEDSQETDKFLTVDGCWSIKQGLRSFEQNRRSVTDVLAPEEDNRTNHEKWSLALAGLQMDALHYAYPDIPKDVVPVVVKCLQDCLDSLFEGRQIPVV